MVKKRLMGYSRAKFSESHRSYCTEIAEPEAFAGPGNEILVSFRAARILPVMLLGQIWSGEVQGPFLPANVCVSMGLTKSILPFLGEGKKSSLLNDLQEMGLGKDSPFP